MGSASSYLENKVLDHVLGNVAYTAPTNVFIGLWTTTLTASSTGSTAGEVSGSGYARVQMTNNTTNWPVASGGSKSNGTIANFGTAGASWGTVTHMAICDASTGGNILYWSALTNQKTVDPGDSVQYPVSGITVTLT